MSANGDWFRSHGPSRARGRSGEGNLMVTHRGMLPGFLLSLTFTSPRQIYCFAILLVLFHLVNQKLVWSVLCDTVFLMAQIRQTPLNSSAAFEWILQLYNGVQQSETIHTADLQHCLKILKVRYELLTSDETWRFENWNGVRQKKQTVALSS